jgi:hypothetical protein
MRQFRLGQLGNYLRLDRFGQFVSAFKRIFDGRAVEVITQPF